MPEQMDAPYKAPSRFLPPPDVWIHDPRKDDPIPTPLDERGLVDMAELIRLMKLSLDPNYDWESPFVDDHHLHWPKRWYDPITESDKGYQEFRNLTISRMDVPRLFHNWVHLVTEPPPIPDEEVMRYRIEAQNVAVSLFRYAKSYAELPLRKGISDASLEKQMQEKFESFNTTFERARQLPVEFQLLDFATLPLHTPEDMAKIRKLIGKYAFPLVATNLIAEPLAA